MVCRLDASSASFDEELDRYLMRGVEAVTGVTEAVAEIIADVRQRGDVALLDYSQQFDDPNLMGVDELVVSEAELAAAAAAVPPAQRDALELMAERIRAYHGEQVPRDHSWQDAAGVTLGWRWQAIEAVGVYAPGGRAQYPSSVLMSAIPARVAGVQRLVLCSPAASATASPLVLYAAKLAGIEEVYRVGGAQAIAALAYGTERLPRVDKLAGPGNAYVTAAKRLVADVVGIDLTAGPSEMVVVADDTNCPQHVALDLLAQAEHDPLARSMLITPSAEFGARVETAIEEILSDQIPSAVARSSWDDSGAIIVSPGPRRMAELVDRIAPEHLHLCTDDAGTIAEQVRCAGAIFTGADAAGAFADYIAGPSHVLPTAGAARYDSGLSVLDFMTRSSILAVSPEAMAKLGPGAAAVADAEGLPLHAASLRARLPGGG